MIAIVDLGHLSYRVLESSFSPGQPQMGAMLFHCPPPWDRFQDHPQDPGQAAPGLGHWAGLGSPASPVAVQSLPASLNE